MKKSFKITKVKTWALIFTLGLFMINLSCEEEKFFDGIGPVLASYNDGIQNLDEEGIDCGGGSGVNCPSCSDGIQNRDETGIDCGGSECAECPDETPRADALQGSGLPYFHTFESNDPKSGFNLQPRPNDSQGVNLFYGESDPTGGDDVVTRIVRPDDGRFGGFEDMKFTQATEAIDFSAYNKFTLDVYIPEGQDFSGSLEPQVELILHDNNDAFFQRWTVISQVIAEEDFGSWVTLYFNGANATSANDGTLLPDNMTYDNITLRFGGSNHTESGTFFIKDFLPTTSFVAEGTPRADELANSSLPLYYTFETGDATSGLNLIPRDVASQGVVPSYGVADPAGSSDGVGKIVRPQNGPFGGFEDFKFQPQGENIDFSVYHKFRLNVYIPSTNDFTGALVPLVELILHDNDANFFNRWTVIAISVDEADFDKWVTLEFDGSQAMSAADGTLLPANSSYSNYTLRFGGFAHQETGEFFLKDFVPFQ